MIPEHQKRMIDKPDTFVGQVLMVMADATEPMEQKDIIAKLDIRKDQVNSALLRILKQPYCKITISGKPTVKKYMLEEMIFPISQVRSKEWATVEVYRPTRHDNILAGVFS